MIIGEVRMFQIDISRKIYCRLNPNQEDKKIVEIKIRKIGPNSNNCKDCSRFEMDGEETDVYLSCKPGNYDVNVEGPASGCGISQILIQLCMNEPRIHEIKYNGNQAMKLLEADYLELNNLNWLSVDWVKSNCKKIIYLDNLDKPLSLVSLYLKAAILSQFKLTLIKLLDSKMYPSTGAIATKDLLKRYYGIGGVVKYYKVINVQGTFKGLNVRQWFFCYPCEGNKCKIS